VSEVRVLDGADDDAIEDFLAANPEAGVYHTPAWRDALVATYGYEPVYLGLFEGGKMACFLPLMEVSSRLTGRRLVSLPFANACGPIGPRPAAALLIEEVIEICKARGLRAVEIRTQADVNPVADARLSPVSYFITSIVDLDPDPEVVWKRFKDRNVRTEVRQGLKKGIGVRPGADEADLEIFYDLYAPARQKHGVPPQPYSFFRSLWHHLRPRYLDLLLAEYQGRPVGGLITLGAGRTLCAAYIGADEAYRSYRVHQVLFWKAMETGCVGGFERFDFLRTPKKSESLRYFKERWNAYEVDLSYLYYPEVRGTASTVEETAMYKVMAAVLRKSPPFVGKMLGRVMYRHLG
jgi:serine/alanine adding enzyme